MKKNYNTKTKELIKQYIEANNECCFSVNDIYEYAHLRGSEVDLSTIYRNLEKLTESGELMRHKAPEDGRHVYQYIPNESCYEHLHLQCSMCGRIIHIDSELMKIIKKYAVEQEGFYLQCEGSVINGTCRDCKSKDN